MMLWKPLRVLVALILATSIMVMDGRAQNDSGAVLSWVQPKAKADLVKLRKTIESRGGKVLTLAPEGRLLVRHPAGAKLAAIPEVGVAQSMTAPPVEPQPAGRGLGARKPTRESMARFNASRVTSVAPNTLGTDRATLQGEATLASSVDNSLSIYFPPIRSQGAQGSCVAWASGYYYNTFTQASDENLNASTGDNNAICSPAFLYNLLNGGADGGLLSTDGVDMLNWCGACSWNSMPYNAADFLTWPTEAAWIDALKGRTAGAGVIGDWYDGCTDDDILAIKQHLANGNIAVTGGDIFDNLYVSYPNNTTGVNNGVLFAHSASYVGGHAMTVVGYDDNKSYFDGATTKYGAFLLANSWGSNWGTYNSAGTSKGYLWVAYDYFRLGHSGSYEVFGTVYFNSDRDNYRSKLYAAAGVNHANRGRVALNGGVGPAATPAWLADYPIAFSGGLDTAVNDTKRIIVDLNDGIGSINMPYVELFTEMYLSSYAATNGSMTNVTFFHDFDRNGTYEQVAASNTPLTVAPDGTIDATTQFTWSDGSVNQLSWSAIGAQQAYLPFTATITARDTLQRAVAGFTGTATLTGCVDSTVTAGTGTDTSSFPLYCYWNVSRSTHLYLQGELGGAATLSGLQLDVSILPGMSMTNFTVRMKHTSLGNLDSVTSWDNSGWTTVYHHDLNVNKTGWITLPFDTTFAYNGSNNVMIDFSFSNYSWATSGYVNSTDTGVNRTIFSAGDIYPDPLTWTVTPAIYRDSVIPNIKLVKRQTVAVSPAATGNFAAGAWTGSLTITTPATGMYILASDGAGHTGRSNMFNVAPGSPTGSLTVTIGPAEAVTAGAMWRRVGQSTWRASGSTESGIPAGSYTIEFGPAPGWNAAASQPVTITSGGSASASGIYTQMSVVWIDFGFGGTEYGTQAAPYCLLDRGINAVTSGGLIYLKPGTSSQTLRITKPVRLESVGGTATVGK